MSREHVTFDRRTVLKTTAAGAVVGLAGCLGGDDEEREEITITQGTFPDTLDPIGHNDGPTYNVQDQAYEQLIYRDEENELIGHLATDWDRIDDETVELEVRDDVTFHSGNEMTADDVAYSINRTNESAQQGGIVGAIEEAEAVDDYTVEINLEGPEPAIFRNLSHVCRVVEEEWMEDNDPGEEVNGTGPYELEEFDDDNQAIFTRFDDYWGDEPDLERITFNAVDESGTRVDRLTTGESDLVTSLPPDELGDVEDDDDVRVETELSNRSLFLVMPNDEAPFDSVEFRQAMNYAVDLESVIDSVLHEWGEVTSQPTLEGHFGHNPDVEPYDYDPEQADQLIEESGYVDEDFTIHTTTGRYVEDVNIAEAVAGQIDDLENVGSVDVEQRDNQNLFSETDDGDMSTSPDIFLLGWGNPTFDANYTLEPWFTEGPYHHFDDDELAGMIEDAQQETDEDEREELLQDINEYVNEQAPWVFLNQQYSIYGVNDDFEWDAREDEDVLARHIDGA